MTPTRRQFLRRTLATVSATWCIQGSPSPHAWGSSQAKSTPDVVLYRGTYPGWPWITASADGTLYCVFREGTRHEYCAGGRAMICSSEDGGHHWSVPRVLVDAPQVDDRNVAITQLGSGDLLAVYNTYDVEQRSQAMTLRSADRGQTWSAPCPLDRPNTRTRAAVVSLSDGTLLLPYYVAPGNGSLAAVSHDDGQSWQTHDVPQAEGFVGDEWDVLELTPGRLIGIHRNSHPRADGTFWKSESLDGGRTWSVPRPTNIRDQRSSSPPQIVRQQGRPTVIYCDRRMISVSAVRSRDPDLLVWDLDQRLLCYRYQADESPLIDAGYPVSVPVGNQRRLIVDYELRGSGGQIAGYFISFPDDW